MKIYRDGSVIFDSIDNTGSTDASSLGARFALDHMNNTWNSLTQNYYTKAEVLELIAQALNEASLLKAMVVPAVPAVSTAASNIIYLVPVAGQENIYTQYKKVLVAEDPEEYAMAMLGSTEVALDNIQVTELPSATADVGNKVFQYIGNSSALVRGRFWWCAPKPYYAWDYVSGGSATDAGTYFVENDPPVAGDSVYIGTWMSGEFIPSQKSTVQSVSGTTMVDAAGRTYTKNAAEDVTGYHWIPLITKLSAFENDGDGSSPFVTQAGMEAALALKQDSVTGGASTIVTNNLAASRALVSNASGKVTTSSVTSTELGYMSGVTSSVQTQINNLSSGAVACYSFTAKMNTGTSNVGIADQNLYRIKIGNKNFLTGQLKVNFKSYSIPGGWSSYSFTKMNFTIPSNMAVCGNFSSVDRTCVPFIRYNGEIAVVASTNLTTASNTALEMTIPMLPLSSYS